MQQFISGKILTGLVVVAGILLAINNANAGGGADIFWSQFSEQAPYQFAVTLPTAAPVVGYGLRSGIGDLGGIIFHRKIELVGPGAYHLEQHPTYVGLIQIGEWMDSAGNFLTISKDDLFENHKLTIRQIQPATGGYIINNLPDMETTLTGQCTKIISMAARGRTDGFPGFVIYAVTVRDNPTAGTPLDVELIKRVIQPDGTQDSVTTVPFTAASPGVTPGRQIGYNITTTYSGERTDGLQIAHTNSHDVILILEPVVKIPALVNFSGTTVESFAIGQAAITIDNYSNAVTQKALIMGNKDGERSSPPNLFGCPNLGQGGGSVGYHKTITGDGADSAFLTFRSEGHPTPNVILPTGLSDFRPILTKRFVVSPSGAPFINNYQYPLVHNQVCTNQITWAEPTMASEWTMTVVDDVNVPTFDWTATLTQFNPANVTTQCFNAAATLSQVVASVRQPGLGGPSTISGIYTTMGDDLLACSQAEAVMLNGYGLNATGLGTFFNRKDITFNGNNVTDAPGINLPDIDQSDLVAASVFDFVVHYTLGSTTSIAHSSAGSISSTPLAHSLTSIYGTNAFIKTTSGGLLYHYGHPQFGGLYVQDGLGQPLQFGVVDIY